MSATILTEATTTVTSAITGAVTIAEAATLAGMTRNGLRWHVDRGHIDVIGTPYGRAVVRESLEEFLRNRAQVKETAIASR